MFLNSMSDMKTEKPIFVSRKNRNTSLTESAFEFGDELPGAKLLLCGGSHNAVCIGVFQFRVCASQQIFLCRCHVIMRLSSPVCAACAQWRDRAIAEGSCMGALHAQRPDVRIFAYTAGGLVQQSAQILRLEEERA